MRAHRVTLAATDDGRDVTRQVTELLRTASQGNETTRYMCLPREFNAVFGDPSFGNEKILVVDYRTRCVWLV